MVNLMIPSTPKDYSVELALGNIPRREGVNIAGHNDAVGASVETLWDQGGLYTYLTADTTLYISSDDASDTDINVILYGLDDTYNDAFALVNSDGETQTPFDTQMFRVFSAAVIGPEVPLGDLYIAEATASPGGVPTDVTKIKAKIIQGKNLTRMGMYTNRAGSTAVIRAIRGSVGKGDDANIGVCTISDTGVCYEQNPFQLYEGTFGFDFRGAGITFPEKWDAEIRAFSSVASLVSAEIDGELTW